MTEVNVCQSLDLVTPRSNPDSSWTFVLFYYRKHIIYIALNVTMMKRKDSLIAKNKII